MFSRQKVGLNQAYLQLKQIICWRYSKDKIRNKSENCFVWEEKQISTENDRHYYKMNLDVLSK
jgi:hypothetical protein